MSKLIHAGYVALIGQPNVGKSTLLNHILGKKVSITSHKPQTTRHRLLGIKTTDDAQYVFVDTPGVHDNVKRAMNRYMNKAALSTLHDVDVILFMVSELRWDDQDEYVLKQLEQVKTPIILVINKIDLVPDRKRLLPRIETLSRKYNFFTIVPISAEKGEQIDNLLEQIKKCLPKQPQFFEGDRITDRSDQFIVAERLREKLTRNLGQELPYALTVTIDIFEDEEKIVKTAATIWVEKATQKSIVIGKEGAQLKRIATATRLELEKYFEKKVFLKVWVKVKDNWSDDERSLNQLGYGNE